MNDIALVGQIGSVVVILVGVALSYGRLSSKVDSAIEQLKRMNGAMVQTQKDTALNAKDIAANARDIAANTRSIIRIDKAGS